MSELLREIGFYEDGFRPDGFKLYGIKPTIDGTLKYEISSSELKGILREAGFDHRIIDTLKIVPNKAGTIGEINTSKIFKNGTSGAIQGQGLGAKYVEDIGLLHYSVPPELNSEGGTKESDITNFLSRKIDQVLMFDTGEALRQRLMKLKTLYSKIEAEYNEEGGSEVLNALLDDTEIIQEEIDDLKLLSLREIEEGKERKVAVECAIQHGADHYSVRELKIRNKEEREKNKIKLTNLTSKEEKLIGDRTKLQDEIIVLRQSMRNDLPAKYTKLYDEIIAYLKEKSTRTKKDIRSDIRSIENLLIKEHCLAYFKIICEGPEILNRMESRKSELVNELTNGGKSIKANLKSMIESEISKLGQQIQELRSKIYAHPIPSIATIYYSNKGELNKGIVEEYEIINLQLSKTRKEIEDIRAEKNMIYLKDFLNSDDAGRYGEKASKLMHEILKTHGPLQLRQNLRKQLSELEKEEITLRNNVINGGRNAQSLEECQNSITSIKALIDKLDPESIFMQEEVGETENGEILEDAGNTQNNEEERTTHPSDAFIGLAYKLSSTRIFPW